MNRTNIKLLLGIIISIFSILIALLLDASVVALFAPIVGATTFPLYVQLTILLVPLPILIPYILKKGRQRTAQLIVSLLIVTAIVQLLKFLIDRARPETTMELGNSFPSNHAALVFSALPFAFAYNKKFGIAWLIYALIITFSRLLLGAHYLSDVVAGSIIGYTIGLGMYVWWKKKT